MKIHVLSDCVLVCSCVVLSCEVYYSVWTLGKTLIKYMILVLCLDCCCVFLFFYTLLLHLDFFSLLMVCIPRSFFFTILHLPCGALTQGRGNSHFEKPLLMQFIQRIQNLTCDLPTMECHPTGRPVIFTH